MMQKDLQENAQDCAGWLLWMIVMDDCRLPDNRFVVLLI